MQIFAKTTNYQHRHLYKENYQLCSKLLRMRLRNRSASEIKSAFARQEQPSNMHVDVDAGQYFATQLLSVCEHLYLELCAYMRIQSIVMVHAFSFSDLQ